MAAARTGRIFVDQVTTCDQQRFERDVAQHKMTIIRDNDVDSHIKFRRADDSAYWF